MKRSKPLPFVAIGNDELGEEIGKMARCSKCEKSHPVKYGDKIIDGKKYPSKMMGYVKCGKNAYLVAIDGKKIIREVKNG